MRLKQYDMIVRQSGTRMEERTDGDFVLADEAQKEIDSLLAGCKAVLASLEKLASDGEIIWLDPPHVMSGVHESAIERLKNVIAQAEGRPIE